MRKAVSVISFIISIFVLIALVALSLYVVAEYEYITSNGTDFFGIGLLYGIMAFCSLNGMIASGVCLMLTENKPIRRTSWFFLAVFALAFLFSTVAFLL